MFPCSIENAIATTPIKVAESNTTCLDQDNNIIIDITDVINNKNNEHITQKSAKRINMSQKSIKPKERLFT